MTSPERWEIFLFVLAVALSALFSAAETALVSIRRSRLQAMVDEGRRSALLVQKALDRPERTLTSIQAVNTTLAMLAAVSATLLLLRASDTGASLQRVIVSWALAWVVYLLFGEVVPKVVARRHSDAAALLLIRPVRLMSTFVFPLVLGVVRLGDLVVRLIPGQQPLSRNPYITEEEIKVLVEKGEEMGDLEEDEREMVTAIFDLDRSVVREVMVPRVDVVAADVNDPLDDLIDTLISSGHTRLPLYEGSLDNVVGVLHAKDLLRYLRHGRHDFTLLSVMRPATFVPENKNAKVLMEEMRARRIPFAIVVDEYGGTAGIITLEDLIEEIVGEIRDEYDVEEEDIVLLGDDVALVNGRSAIDEVNEDLDVDIPTDEYDTVGGFVVGVFGHPPEAGDECRWRNIRFIVESVSGNRVILVRILVDRSEREHA